MTTRTRLALAAALLILVAVIGLLQPTGLFAPFDQLAMKIVGHLRRFPGAGLATLAAQALDALGSAGGRIWIAAIIGLFLARAGRSQAMLWLLLTVCAMALLNPLVKLLFHAPRPDMLTHLATVTDASFPSGHAAGAMTLYGAIALLIRNRLAWLLCATLILATGLSRVWLGVHWPSDVIGGWMEGLAGLLIASILLPKGASLTTGR